MWHHVLPRLCMRQGLEAAAPRWTLLVWTWPLPSWTASLMLRLDKTSCSQTTATNGCTRTRTTVREPAGLPCRQMIHCAFFVLLIYWGYWIAHHIFFLFSVCVLLKCFWSHVRSFPCLQVCWVQQPLWVWSCCGTWTGVSPRLTNISTLRRTTSRFMSNHIHLLLTCCSFQELIETDFFEFIF